MSGRHTDDELSIDSTADGKKTRPPVRATLATTAATKPNSKTTFVNASTTPTTLRSGATMRTDLKGGSCGGGGPPKAHFRIDWRQLTYYSKEQNSCLANWFCLGGAKGDKRPPSYLLAADDDEPEQEEVEEDEAEERSATDETDGSASYCGLSDLKPSARRGRPILNSLDGCFRSGELAAILGPSGAGKSTFLSALFGNKQESSYGQTRVTWFPPAAGAQGEPGARAGDQHQQRAIRIAFLPQHDHLLSHLTVYETLMFASKIKNPHQASDKSFHRQNVKRVAKMLKLTDCFSTRCGRLSGGQYKRVSIGQELLSEPDVIILDEPTSGLDAMTCLTTVRTLKSIVLRHPISIILTIHQPDLDVFNLFDQVYVIAQGGMAIYEGPPQGVVPTLAQANLFMPSESYNPARFIVENAFVADLEATGATGGASGALDASGPGGGGSGGGPTSPGEQRRAFALPTCAASISEEEEEGEISSTDEEEEEEEGAEPVKGAGQEGAGNFLRRSISSLTDALAGKTPDLNPDRLLRGPGDKFRDSGRRPLLNIGIQTADGKLITSDQLAAARQAKAANLESQQRKQQIERLQLLRRLNRMQREKYYGAPGAALTSGPPSCGSSDIVSQRTGPSEWPDSVSSAGGGGAASSPHHSTASLDSASWSEARETIDEGASQLSDGPASHFVVHLAAAGQAAGGAGLCSSAATTLSKQRPPTGLAGGRSSSTSSATNDQTARLSANQMLLNERLLGPGRRGRHQKLRRQFDKRLSAKHIQSKQSGYPIWYHAALLTQRTWLSIVRDPIFFGIQFTMHTTIPILLALIFGSVQEEGCPQVGNFDLVQFAYADQANFIASTMRSIRQSIGNIGIIFFEMFVLSFAINCITALVFPLDMHVLLKEYRNGWYSLRSYFFGRTLADLPVPIVLHSMAMSILCYLTGQPLAWWRFAAIIGIVILASLVAQSVGLTIGALLMRSSQSAVLAAAGIVAPFFALSGFIVRIHTLPWVAKWAAQGSYLYHLLNGFIIMRYGFGRCACDDEDFEQDPGHAIPGNLKTMASLWIGTYSNEFEHSPGVLAATAPGNRTNVDPNIDIIDKLMGAFKMANSFGHRVDTCDDVLPYAMLDFNLKDHDIWHSCLSLALMLLVSRAITFGAIYYKVRSFS